MLPWQAADGPHLRLLLTYLRTGTLGHISQICGRVPVWQVAVLGDDHSNKLEVATG